MYLFIRTLSLAFTSFLCLCWISLAGGCSSEEQKESDQSFQIPEDLDRQSRIRFEQYAVQGRLLYKQHCENCHQKDGTGLAQLIPPLAKSDFLKENPQKAVCIIRYGLDEPITVNGENYHQPMPANPQLRAIEIAEITTYILNAWGNQEGYVSVQQAQDWLKNCTQTE